MFKLNDSIRREIKFKVFFKDIGKLYSWLHRSSFKKKYDDRVVNTIYYDTPNLDFAKDNIIGQSKRVKIRARWYSKVNENIFNDFIKPNKYYQFEIKRKINKYSDKLILPKIYCTYENNINERRIFLKEELSIKLINLKNLSNLILQDKVFVGYKREYYEHILYPKLRFTIDKDLVCFLSSNFQNKKIIKISKDFLIAEIKIKEDSELKNYNILKSFPFRQNRSSKYLFAISHFKGFN